jgi:methionyl-tRNA formyltransferase
MRTALLGCKGTTLDLLLAAAPAGIKIDQVITLPEDIAEKNKVAFYQGPALREYCKKNNIPCHTVNTYHLKDTADMAFFGSAGIDLLIVIGWERLVPAEILKKLGRFACGMHGSPYGLPRGKGRSPLNWSLITNQNKFITYLFRYDPGVDSGDIIGFRVFDINPFDTISTLHSKNRIAMQQLLVTYFPQIEANTVAFSPQPPETSTFYPKRGPEDSGIDWSMDTLSIYNHIRAVVPPYPPAFCFLNDQKVFITEAYPFDSGLFHDIRTPGTVADISVAENCFVVKTIDGSLIVKNFEGADIGKLSVGMTLRGVDQKQILENIRKSYSPELGEHEKEI